MTYNLKYKGFTLSETLITIAVIGVVAAVTLPVITKNVQKYVLKNQFKKSLNIISNAVSKTYADYGYFPHCSYGLNDGTNNGSEAECAEFNEDLFKNLKYIKYCQNNALDNGCIADIKGVDTIKRGRTSDLSEEEARNLFRHSPRLREYEIHYKNSAYVLPDGIMIMSYSKYVPLYIIDINGLKKPNKWGYDIFTFYISKYKLVCYGNLGDVLVEDGGTKCSDLIFK